MGTTCLLDTQQEIYRSYGPVQGSYAPFPLQVVIDRDGTIVYLSAQYDADAVNLAIAAALEE